MKGNVMRLVAAVVTLFLALSFSSRVWAQVQLPTNDVIQFVQQAFLAPMWSCVPLGPLPIPSTYVDRNGRLIASFVGVKDLVALEGAGVVKITTSGIGSTNPQVTVDLLLKPDGNTTKLDTSESKSGVQRIQFCMLGFDFSSAQVQIQKVDYAKGGSSGWPAAIANVLINGIKSYPLAEVMFRAEGTDPSTLLIRRYRVLFRFDQSAGRWNYLTADSYDGQKYDSDDVPRSLKED